MTEKKSLVGKLVSVNDLVNTTEFPLLWREANVKPSKFKILAEQEEDNSIYIALSPEQGGFVDSVAKDLFQISETGCWITRNFKDPNQELEDAEEKNPHKEAPVVHKTSSEKIKEKVAVENKTPEKVNGMNENLMAGGVRVVSRKLVTAFQNLLIKGLKMATAKKYGWTEKDMGLKKNAKKIQEVHDFAEMFLTSDIGKVVLNLFVAEMIKLGRNKLGNILPEKAGFGAELIAQEMTTEAASLGMEKILDEGLKLFAPGVAAMISDPENAKLAAIGMNVLSQNDPEAEKAAEKIMNMVSNQATA